MRERKHFPTFVLTVLLKGGLYQRMFLGRSTLIADEIFNSLYINGLKRASHENSRNRD